MGRVWMDSGYIKASTKRNMVIAAFIGAALAIAFLIWG